MKTHMKATISLVCALLVVVSFQHVRGQSARPLFDGESLSDWEFDADYWRAENGAIVGEIPAGTTLNKNTWIIWKGGALRDFDLRLQFKITGLPAANSGIQIRCQADHRDHVSRLPGGSRYGRHVAWSHLR